MSKDKNLSILNAGFSLLEILVTVAIIGIISAISIPNYRKFNGDITLGNAKSDLISVFRKAQTNAQSGMTCSNSLRAFSWEIILTGTNYQLSPICNGVTDAAKTFTYPAEISMSSTSCATAYPQKASVIFSSNTTQIYCYTDSATKSTTPLATPLTITLHSTKVSPDQTITINQGGNFSFN